jgi:transcriptional regulator with XRE-family HTH domain
MTTEPTNWQPNPNSIPADEIFGTEPMSFGEILWCFRKGEGWTLAEAASKLGASKQLLSIYERGKQLPSVAKVIEMALIFEQSPEIWVTFRTMDELKRHGFSATVELKQVS